MTWSARQYATFEQERTRPVRDLVAAIPLAEASAVVDLGCGPGNSTQVLVERFPRAAVSAIDNSSDMIAAARERLPAVRFDLEDIATWDPPEAYDVILANASLQWVPDHASLYPRLVKRLTAGGVLAVQTPDNLQEPAHVLIHEAAAQGAWAPKIADVTHPPRHEAQFYYALLRPMCRSVDVWRTTYFHPLAGPGAIVEWFKSTALRPFLAPLADEERVQFLACYQRLVAKAYPVMADGTVLLPFPRLFLVGCR